MDRLSRFPKSQTFQLPLIQIRLTTLTPLIWLTALTSNGLSSGCASPPQQRAALIPASQPIKAAPPNSAPRKTNEQIRSQQHLLLAETRLRDQIAIDRQLLAETRLELDQLAGDIDLQEKNSRLSLKALQQRLPSMMTGTDKAALRAAIAEEQQTEQELTEQQEVRAIVTQAATGSKAQLIIQSQLRKRLKSESAETDLKMLQFVTQRITQIADQESGETGRLTKLSSTSIQ